MASIQSLNPATGEVIRTIPIASEAEVREAVKRAAAAFPAWSRWAFRERARILLDAREYIRSHSEEIARLITQENGKPIAESYSADVFPAMDLATFFAKNAEKILRDERIWLGKWFFMGRTSRIEYQAIGAVGIIAPWNYPFSIPCGQVMMALIAGNTVVLKPSEFTPLVGLKVQEVFKAAGLPPDVLQVISGDGSTGAALVQSDVKKIFFTGSVPTGKKIMAAAAPTLKHVCLELGGKDPMIVLEDADLEVAASGALWGSFSNSGQTCAAVERLYVHEKVYDVFVAKLVEKAERLRQGNGLNADMDMGSMSNEMQLNKVIQHVDEAKQAGAHAILGGSRRPSQVGYFFPPTILTHVNHHMSVMTEETFGPVVGIMKFRDTKEAIRLANDSHYGLTASVWTKNISQGMEIARRLEAGTVTINEHMYSYALAQTPWGGPKESGIGRTHGRLGLLEMVEAQHIHVNHAARVKDFWWYPYSENKVRMFRNLADFLFGTSWSARLRAGLSFVALQLRIRHL